MRIDFKIACILILASVFESCHWQADVAVVENNTSDTITCLLWDDEPITDNMLYNDRLYFKYWIDPKQNETVSLPNRKFKNAPDSEKVFLYLFNIDSLNKYQKSKQLSGILKKSLLKKVVFQLNKIVQPLDTIYAYD